jgi:hypothetical protein
MVEAKTRYPTSISLYDRAKLEKAAKKSKVELTALLEIHDYVQRYDLEQAKSTGKFFPAALDAYHQAMVRGNTYEELVKAVNQPSDNNVL